MESISSKRQRREFGKIAKILFEDSGEVFYLNEDGFIKNKQTKTRKHDKSKTSSNIPDNQKMPPPPFQIPIPTPVTAPTTPDKKGEESIKKEEETFTPNFDFQMIEESNLDIRMTETDFMIDEIFSECNYFTTFDTSESFL